MPSKGEVGVASFQLPQTDLKLACCGKRGKFWFLTYLFILRVGSVEAVGSMEMDG